MKKTLNSLLARVVITRVALASSLVGGSLLLFGVMVSPSPQLPISQLLGSNKIAALQSAANGQIISANPNPAIVCEGGAGGTTTITWSVPEGQYEIRRDTENGSVVTSTTRSGSIVVTDIVASTQFFIRQAVSTTTIQWRYVKGNGWIKVPNTSIEWSTIGQISVGITNNGCSAIGSVPAAGLNGAFMYAPTIANAKVPAYLDELKSLKMDTVIIAHVRTKTGDCNSNTFSWGPEMPDKLGTVLDGAYARGMQVYVGLDFSMDVCPAYYYGNNATQVVNDVGVTLASIMQRYGSHAALAGWYIPDEPDFVYMDMNTGVQYYANLVNKIREKSQKPIVIAPFLAGQSTTSPTDLAARALDFKNRTGVTIEIWQDSIGADPNLNIVGAGYTTRDYYSALVARMGQSSVWSDIELFNCCTTLNFSGGTYRPASITRIATQIESVSGSGKKLSWLPQFHMGSVDPNRFPGAERLLASYKAWYGLQDGYSIIHPVSYTWNTSPAVNYPDAGATELINGKVGIPRDFSNPEWVGVNGSAEFVADLGSSKSIDWVAVHTMHKTAPSIFLPSELDISCSVDAQTWSSPVKSSLPVSYADSEYVISNSQPLHATCRYIKIRLQNTGWTFLSELEIVSGR